ncbi:myotrophin [Teleopsis dalmanni]|uniref:myotrophin n=1 Tax=Teleopsis dalmanni TaxID=139649 RepID=UPI0018CE4401|nr:myotrophin [Teleopsis dalmanni]XP_037927795.1 myotrophin [Teleopsis dalmanni]
MALVWSIKNGDLEQVQTILEESNVANNEIDGRYPVHYAADYGQYDVLKLLIDFGADVDKKDKHGITPLLAAIWEGHEKCVNLLLEKGASKDGTTLDGRPYHEAAENENIRKLLL